MDHHQQQQPPPPSSPRNMRGSSTFERAQRQQDRRRARQQIIEHRYSISSSENSSASSEYSQSSLADHIATTGPLSYLRGTGEEDQSIDLPHIGQGHGAAGAVSVQSASPPRTGSRTGYVVSPTRRRESGGMGGGGSPSSSVAPSVSSAPPASSMYGQGGGSGGGMGGGGRATQQHRHSLDGSNYDITAPPPLYHSASGSYTTTTTTHVATTAHMVHSSPRYVRASSNPTPASPGIDWSRPRNTSNANSVGGGGGGGGGGGSFRGNNNTPNSSTPANIPTSEQSQRQLLQVIEALRQHRHSTPVQGTETAGFVDDSRSDRSLGVASMPSFRDHNDRRNSNLSNLSSSSAPSLGASAPSLGGARGNDPDNRFESDYSTSLARLRVLSSMSNQSSARQAAERARARLQKQQQESGKANGEQGKIPKPLLGFLTPARKEGASKGGVDKKQQKTVWFDVPDANCRAIPDETDNVARARVTALTRASLLLCAAGAMVAIAVFAALASQSANSSETPSSPPASSDSEQRQMSFRSRLVEEGISLEVDLDTVGSPQQRALDWICTMDPAKLDVSEPYLSQRYSLVVFYFATGGEFIPTEDGTEVALTRSPTNGNEQSTQELVQELVKGEKELEAAKLEENGEALRDGDEGTGRRRNFFRRAASEDEDNNSPTGAPAWTVQTNWLTGAGHCSWYGVHCPPQTRNGYKGVTQYDENEGVITLNVTGNALRGDSLPRELFTAFGGGTSSRGTMRDLDLSYNDELEGTLPTQIGLLDSLENMYLNSCLFSGVIPDELCALSNLQNLHLEGNMLGGPLPDKIGDMGQLREIAMHDNYLNGTIPESIGNLQLLVALYLDSNDFSGQIPTTLGEIRPMNDLRLRNNKFSGTIPSQIGDMTVVEILYLDTNRLTGTIPKEISNLKFLDEIHLYKNELTGTLPSELGVLEDLVVMYFDHNQLNGSIPIEFCGLHDLQELYLSKNNLSGTFPPELRHMHDIWNFRAYENQISGTIPSEVGYMFKLEHLFLEDNKLSGPIPSEIGDLTKLKKFRVHKNNITGTVPDRVCGLTDFDLVEFSTDCDGFPPEVECDCCTCDFQ